MARGTVKQEPGVAKQKHTLPTRSSSVISISSSRAASSTTVTPEEPAHDTPMATDEDVDMNAGVDMNEGVDMNPDATTQEAPDAVQALGSDSRALIDAVHKLAALNIDTTIPSMPKIVVVGDQSAGKSSVIEATCDLQLPRSTGTCTRCPFQITTSASQGSGPWNCRVELHYKYSYQPGTRHTSAFDDWVEQDMEIVSFTTVWGKTELELALRRAQLAILNPSQDPKQFVSANMDTQHRRQIEISPNVIAMMITGPGLPELSLYDLPGAINSMGEDDDNESLPTFVENLMKHYMADPKSIILLVCPANQDLEVVTSYRYLKSCPGARERSMGVISKPDLMEKSQAKFDSIRNTLAGNRFKVGYGWFVSRQLSQEELDKGVSYIDARQREAQWFDNEPWATISSDFPNRLGIKSLQKALAQKLTAEIASAIPEVITRVQGGLAEVDRKLSQFPEQAKAPNITVMLEVARVTAAISKELDSDGNGGDFRSRYLKILTDFHKRLRAARPKLSLGTPGYIKPSIPIESDEEMDDTPSKSRRTDKNRGTPFRNTNSSQSSRNTESRESRRKMPPHTEEHASNVHVVFRLGEVKRILDAAPGSDLGGDVDTRVRNLLTLKAIRHSWKQIVTETLFAVRALFQETLQRIIGVQLEARRTQQIHHETIQIAEAYLEQLIRRHLEVVNEMVKWEERRPIIYDRKALKSKQDEQHQAIINERRFIRIREHFETEEALGLRVPNQQDQRKKAADAAQADALLGPDDYDREIEVLARPLAYYDIVVSQFANYFAKSLESMLLYPYAEGIQEQLQVLYECEEEQCAQLLAEDPRRERMRAELIGQRQRLTTALEELSKLPGVHV